MRYTIIQSKAVFIVYEGNKILKMFYNYNDAEAYARKLKYINLIQLADVL